MYRRSRRRKIAADGGQRSDAGRSMAETSKEGRWRDHPAASATVLPEELLAWEILIRLPAKDLLRCRAVCRAWRRLTSAADFLLAHHRRQPSLPLVCLHGDTQWNGWNRVGSLDAALDAFDLRQRPTERQPVLRFNDYSDRRWFSVHASCDGLILLSLSNGRFFVCNPTTRQWISVPPIKGARIRIAGMYLHAASGDYRVLYWTGDFGQAFAYHVLTVGSSVEPRCIRQPTDSPSLMMFLGTGLILTHQMCFSECTSVLLHDCLHWIQFKEMEKKAILVFDTVRESFRLMCYPTVVHSMSSQLLEMGGTLAISCPSESSVKLCVLQDYETEAWLLKYQIELPLAEMSSMAGHPMFMGIVVSENGDALIHCLNSLYLFHIDSKGKLLQKFHWDGMLSWPTGFRFKESLVRHAFLERPKGGRQRQPRFFRGL